MRNTVHEQRLLAPTPLGTLVEVGNELHSRPYARRGVPARTQPITVMLVDDLNLVRTGIKALLQRCRDITIIGEADNGRSAVTLAARTRPEVIVMDLEMPDGDGLTATRAMRATVPDSLVLIVTMSPEHETLLPVLHAGARGCLCKSAFERDLVEAIRVVAAGDVYVRPCVSLAIATSPAEPPRQRDDARARLARLSEREQLVVVLTARGYNGPEVGRQLGIAAKTVDTYKQRIADKVGLSHRTEYVRIALEADLFR